MAIQTQSREALREMIDLLQQVDQRWAGPEWNIHSEEDVAHAHRSLMHILEGGLSGFFESDAANPLAVACRVDVIGRGAPIDELEAWQRAARALDLHLFSETCCFFIESVNVHYVPQGKLEELAVGNDPPGAMARTLMTLARSPGDPERAACIERARSELERHAYRPEFAALQPPSLSDQAVVERLEAAGTRALEMLLQQRRESGLDTSEAGATTGSGSNPGSSSNTGSL